MTPQEAFTVGARAWLIEATLATHRNLCKNCDKHILCLQGEMLLNYAEDAKRKMMETAKELGIETIGVYDE